MKRNRSDLLADQGLALQLIGAANEFFTRYFHELTVLSPCALPHTGPAILVCNHTAGIDPLLIQTACPRLVVWMIAKEYYDLWPLRYLFRKLEMIPVQRSGRDMAATREALRALSAGRVLGLFPEGRIAPNHELLPFQSGVALLASKSGAPVFPAYLDGTQRGREMVPSLLRPCSATLAFGRQVSMDYTDTSKEGLERATLAIRQAVSQLRDRSMAGR